jgi:hypothetical protein
VKLGISLLVACLATGVAGAVVACGSTASTEVLPPLTGIVVRAESVAGAFGCGERAAQVFKYVVIVRGANPPGLPAGRDEFLAANVFDCFADGQFMNLPAVTSPAAYGLEVLGYDRLGFEAVNASGALTGLLSQLAALRAAVAADGGASDRAAVKVELDKLLLSNATYRTSCEASQVTDVESVATCKSLVRSDAGTP